jgi:hypothetical protein
MEIRFEPSIPTVPVRRDGWNHRARGHLVIMALLAGAQSPVRDDFKWDVFLSYRHPDRDAVEQIAKKLGEMGLQVWWDEWEVAPGDKFQEKLWDGLKRSRATAVFIGPKTVGGWQEQEVQTAIDIQVKEGRRVIPIFLPDVPDPDQIDIPFVPLNSRVVFQHSLTDQRVINRIYWGITGINPDRPPKAPPPEPQEPQADAVGSDEGINWLSDWLRSGNVTFFVGPGVAGGGSTFPPRNWDIARNLLSEMKLIETDDIKFLPPMDIATTLFAVSKTDPVLEVKIVSLIQSRSSLIPPAQQNLANLLMRLTKREMPRGRKPQKQLVLTTNIDLMTERALLRSGVRFTRVVQHKSQPSLYVTSYHDVPVIPSNPDQLDDLITAKGAKELSPEAVAGDMVMEPILYKLHGSQDIEGSCALTRPQLLAQARSAIANHLIPAELQKIASNTPIVFLGTGLLDPDFQYISQTVLFDAWESAHPKYLVQLAPDQDSEDGYRRMEAGIWDKIKQSAMQRKLATIEEFGDRFLQRLTDAL